MISRCRGAAATTLFLAAALTSCGQPPAIPAVPLDGPILLRLAPPEGQVSRYAYSMETSVESPMMPSTDPVMTMRWQQTQTVLGAEDEVFRVRSTVDSASTTMGVGMPGMDNLLPDPSGMSFTTDMDSRGGVLGVIESEGVPDVAGFSLEEMMKGTSYFVLPENEVRPGDSWTLAMPVDFPMGPGGAMSMETEFTYTFASLEEGLATLSFDGPLEMNMAVEGMSMSGTGTLTGTMVVDLVEGRHVSQTSQTSIDMTMAGMTTKVNSTTTFELIPSP